MSSTPNTIQDQKKITIINNKNIVITPNDLQALKDGDHDAYSKIFLHWRKPLYNLICKLVASEEHAKDIIQNTFVNLWENRSKIDINKDIRLYLYMVAKQYMLKHLRKEKTHSKYVKYEINTGSNPYTSSEDILIEKELNLLKEIALSKMPEFRQNIYKLSVEEGLDNDEISQKLNISKGTIYTQLSIVRKELREIIKIALLFLWV